MATIEAARKAAETALDEDRYFDGVQKINGAFEAWEQDFLAAHPDLGTQRMDILKTPEAWVGVAKPKMAAGQAEELAAMYALRARLLCALGAQKRAVIDIAAALVLKPEDETLVDIKKAIDAKASANDGDGPAKTPTTIITGFLGAGKTTLLNYILEENHGKKIAIIENEFGEVGIDDKLLNTKSSVTEENIIEMNNGCICCTVRADLISGLKKLHKQTTGKGKPLDAIIIETTGLADPAPVAQTFFADDFVQANMQLDGILTVVDAKHILQHLREVKPEGVVNESVQQIAFADRIMLNKTDLVTPEYLEEVQGELRRVNRTAQIRRTEMAKVDMDFLLGIKAFSLDQVLEQVNNEFLKEDDHGHGASHGDDGGHGGHGGHGDGHGGGHGEDCGECEDGGHSAGHGGGHGDAHGGGHGHGHGAPSGGGHVHDYRVTSVGLERDGEVKREKLDAFLGWLMQEKGPDLYRSKGVLAVSGLPNKFVFHAVHMQFSGKPQQPWAEGEKRCCKMVFIGKNLDRQELTTKFDECLA